MIGTIIHFLQMAFLYSLSAALIGGVILLVFAAEYLKYKDEQKLQHDS